VNGPSAAGCACARHRASFDPAVALTASGDRVAVPRDLEAPGPTGPGRLGVGIDGGVRVVEVREHHPQPRVHAGLQAVHGHRHRRVGHLFDRAAGQLVEAVERAVQERQVHPFEPRLERRIPPLPAVGVGHVQHCHVGSLDPIAHRVGVLVAVGYREGRYTNTIADRYGGARLRRVQDDVAQRDELVPGRVRFEEPRQGRGGVDRHAVGPDDLTSQVDETRVVADVGVGEEEATEGGAIHPSLTRGHELGQLLREVGRGVDHPGLRSRDGEAQGRPAPTEGGVGSSPLAAHAGAPGMGHAPVLRAAQHYQPGAVLVADGVG
jgi:hypothetical protein